jgi:DNA-binding response OmpR family regulator
MPRTILLADDSVTIRKVVELTFSDTDIRVESVGSGREALERLPALRPDLVLADVVMPGPSGYDVCRAVKASDRPVPVLLLAGTFEPFDPVEARRCGSDGHMTKPFDSRTLMLRVEDLLSSPPEAPPLPAEARDEHLEAMLDTIAAPQETPAAVAEPAAEYALAPAAPPPEAPVPAAASLTPADIDAIARAVVAKLSEEILREIAWDVVPDLAEAVVRERLRELEREP